MLQFVLKRECFSEEFTLGTISSDNNDLPFCLSFRSLFSRKSKEPKAASHNAPGWRLFGKTAAREGDQSSDLDATLSTQQVGSLNTQIQTRSWLLFP